MAAGYLPTFTLSRIFVVGWRNRARREGQRLARAETVAEPERRLRLAAPRRAAPPQDSPALRFIAPSALAYPLPDRTSGKLASSSGLVGFDLI